MKTHPKRQSFKSIYTLFCDKCDATYENHNSMHYHKKSSGYAEGTIFPCEKKNCTKKFCTKGVLDRHLRDHDRPGVKIEPIVKVVEKAAYGCDK